MTTGREAAGKSGNNSTVYAMRALPVLDPKAAAIDVGSEQLHVSIGGEEPKVFGTFTGHLEMLRDWLKEQAVRTVAMEATGVYWLYLYRHWYRHWGQIETFDKCDSIFVTSRRSVGSFPQRRTKRLTAWPTTAQSIPPAARLDCATVRRPRRRPTPSPRHDLAAEVLRATAAWDQANSRVP
jgi:hypothetical protein